MDRSSLKEGWCLILNGRKYIRVRRTSHFIDLSVCKQLTYISDIRLFFITLFNILRIVKYKIKLILMSSNKVLEITDSISGNDWKFLHVIIPISLTKVIIV